MQLDCFLMQIDIIYLDINVERCILVETTNIEGAKALYVLDVQL